MIRCLSQALGLPVEKCQRLITDSQYVLTLDYTMKMMNIHERRECGVPVIIEGETGVGKTALVEMLSKLWNHSVIEQGLQFKNNLLAHIMSLIQGYCSSKFKATAKVASYGM